VSPFWSLPAGFYRAGPLFFFNLVGVFPPLEVLSFFQSPLSVFFSLDFGALFFFFPVPFEFFYDMALEMWPAFCSISLNPLPFHVPSGCQCLFDFDL